MTNSPEYLSIELLSDTTFACGEGTAGSVDVEIDRDEIGLPRLGGKAVRGLLRDSWLSMQSHFPNLANAGAKVFGLHADLSEHAILRFGDALLQPEARNFFVAATSRKMHPLGADAILGAVATTRFQTSEERRTGAPAQTTLRSARVALRGITLHAPLTWLAPPDKNELACLALAALVTRHGGLGRNRGRGHLRMCLAGDFAATRALAEGA